jgi:uncharacterized protein YerC
MSDDRTLSELMDSVEEHQKECINCGIPDHGLYNPNYEPDCPWCKLAGTGKFAKPTMEDKSKELDAKVNELLDKGMGYDDISRTLHCSFARISRLRKLHPGPKETRKRDIDRAKKDVKIGVMLLEGKGYDEISQELHCSYHRILRVKNKTKKHDESKQETKPDWFGYEK